MSGHSKWSTIKRKKGATDAARGKIFSKISKEIIVAVRESGSDPDTNLRLRSAIIKARSENMPNDNINRAIKRASGDQGAENFEEIVYEGYGPGGVAMLVFCLSDNRNRTGADVRSVFNKAGGSLGETGSVAYLFSKKGIVTISDVAATEDQVFSLVLEAGAEDVTHADGIIEVVSEPSQFNNVLQSLTGQDIPYESAGIISVPSSYISHDKTMEEKVLKLIGTLEDLDDVQSVSHNLDIRFI